jgi:hypothetical protein
MGDGKPMSISVVRAAGVALLVLGAVVATYAVTRWWTTESVLREAERRLEKALRAEGIYDDFAEARARSAALTLAIPLAGGRYFWWNSALGVFGVGVLIALAGLAMTQVSWRSSRLCGE